MGNEQIINFNPKENIVFNRNFLPFHANGLIFTVEGEDFSYASIFYSVGGGFIVKEGEQTITKDDNRRNFPFPIDKAEELIN